MITRSEITEEQARKAMSEGEFGEDIRQASDHVAVVLTQGWCPQWAALKHTLKSLDGGLEGVDLHVFELVYDRVPYSAEFMSFKEKTFQNFEIPYVRYYSKGELIDESNWVSKKRFLAKLGLK